MIAQKNNILLCVIYPIKQIIIFLIQLSFKQTHSNKSLHNTVQLALWPAPTNNPYIPGTVSKAMWLIRIAN